MKKLKFTQAFTGVEVLLVMALLMMIAGLIIVSSRGVRENAKKRKAEAMIAALEVAISMYQADTGRYPLTDDGTGCTNLYDHLTNKAYAGLPTPPADIPGWRGPYIEFNTEDIVGVEIIDPWKRAYKYDSTDPTHNLNSFDLWSDGPKTTTASDDITNW